MTNCLDCLWAEVCDGRTCCEYYAPLNDCGRILEYNQDLRERHEDYQEIINEFND